MTDDELYAQVPVGSRWRGPVGGHYEVIRHDRLIDITGCDRGPAVVFNHPRSGPFTILARSVARYWKRLTP